MSTMALTTSASPWTIAPASEAGAVEPMVGMGMKLTGMPAAA